MAYDEKSPLVDKRVEIYNLNLIDDMADLIKLEGIFLISPDDKE
jgi:hypothetical protein